MASLVRVTPRARVSRQLRGRDGRSPGRLPAGLVALVLSALGPTLVVGAGPVPAAGAATAAGTGSAPLAVSIATLSPSTIPRSGSVQVSGTVTNRSKGTWTSLTAYLLTSRTPMTTSTQLAAATRTSATAEVGTRVVGTGLYERIPDLAPGASTTYRLSVPRDQLGISGRSGVYWVGVHVLGDSGDGTIDAVADGRARTFMPLVAAKTPSTSLAVTLPLRADVRRGVTGALRNPDRWERLLSAGGRLDRVLRLGETGTQALTWLVDPAVVDAAGSVADGTTLLGGAGSRAGGPARGAGGFGSSHQTPSGSPSGTTTSSTSGPTPSTPTPSTPTPSTPTPSSPTTTSAPSASASAPPTGSTPSPSPQDSTGPDVDPTASPPVQAAQSWLSGLVTAGQTQQVAALPYGDLDVAAALRSTQRRLYPSAVRASRDTLATLGLSSQPIVAPASGLLPGVALGKVPAGTPVVLSPRAFPGRDTTLVGRGEGTPILLSDPGAAAGGPGPNDRVSALAMRQRILSEAALHATTSRSGEPLVVTLPRYWNPGADWETSDFFGGLSTSWLRLVSLADAGATPPSRAIPDAGNGTGAGTTTTPMPTYPPEQRRAEIPFANLLSAGQLERSAQTYSVLVGRRRPVAAGMDKLALLGASLNARDRVERARVQVLGTAQLLRGQLRQVKVEGPGFVMMSSDNGPIQVTLVNDLDVPVTVGVKGSSLSGTVTITAPDPVRLGPGQRTSIRLKSVSGDMGVHAVRLIATNADGTPLGSRAQLTVRTSAVGQVIWFVTGAGALVLFAAILVRLWRRVSRRKATHGPRLAGGE